MNLYKRYFLIVGIAIGLLPLSAVAEQASIVTKISKYSVTETMDRLEAVAKSKQVTIFARIDYTEMANRIDVKIRPAQLLIFGRGKGAPHMIQAAPLVGLSLPPKVLVYEDIDGQVKLSYIIGEQIKRQHRVKDRDAKFKGLTNMLNAVTDKALE
ncbi:MAG: DUF302 domain-containing protein [Rhizobiaceae bacterium]